MGEVQHYLAPRIDRCWRGIGARRPQCRTEFSAGCATTATACDAARGDAPDRGHWFQTAGPVHVNRCSAVTYRIIVAMVLRLGNVVANVSLIWEKPSGQPGLAQLLPGRRLPCARPGLDHPFHDAREGGAGEKTRCPAGAGYPPMRLRSEIPRVKKFGDHRYPRPPCSP
jgi:hypothetical protein